MELIEGECRVKLPGASDWGHLYRWRPELRRSGTSFEIEVTQTLHLDVCHFSDQTTTGSGSSRMPKRP